MKKILKKENLFWFIGMFILLFIIHLPLIIKNILTADVLLNNVYYNGYAWEISLGRFGTFIIGLIKSYLSISHIDLLLSFVLLSISAFLLIDLFEIKSKVNMVFCLLFLAISPIVSATLLFQFWNIAYFLALLFGVLSVYIYYKWNNKYGKIIIPILLIIGSLSFYQAYLSLIVSVFAFYNMKLLLDKKINYKKIIPFIGIVLVGTIIYFVLMKISQIFLHIDMASYSNANKIGISTILSIPSKIKDSYILFYQMFFTDKIMKNSFFHNSIFYILLFMSFIYSLVLYIKNKKLSTKDIFILIVVLLVAPIFLNSVIFVINDSKLQLLMGASYLMIPVFCLSICDNHKSKIIFCILLGLLLRNYFIEDQATYLSLENTFNKYYTVIGSAIQNNINNLDDRFIVVGSFNNKDENAISNIYKYNYGYISDDGIFWDEYNLRKIGFERFCYEYYGLDLKFGSEDEYNNILSGSNDKIIYNEDNLIVINLNNYK